MIEGEAVGWLPVLKSTWKTGGTGSPGSDALVTCMLVATPCQRKEHHARGPLTAPKPQVARYGLIQKLLTLGPKARLFLKWLEVH